MFLKSSLNRRTALYGFIALGHVIFSFVFPWFSVPIVVWLFSRKVMGWFIASFSVPFFTAVIFTAYKKWALIHPQRKMILAAAAFFYCAFYFTLSYAPEKLHILNFSVMGIIFYKFLSPHMRIKRAVIKSLLFTILVGSIDEFQQKWIIGRSSTVHDVFLCVKGAVLGVTIAWIFDKYSRKGRSRPVFQDFNTGK